jgi:hypothetical protein
MSEVQYEPSPLGLALLEVIANGSTKAEALALVKDTSGLARQLMLDIQHKYGNRSLYVMQSVGELMIATVSNTIVRLAKDNTH